MVKLYDYQMIYQYFQRLSKTKYFIPKCLIQTSLSSKRGGFVVAFEDGRPPPYASTESWRRAVKSSKVATKRNDRTFILGFYKSRCWHVQAYDDLISFGLIFIRRFLTVINLIMPPNWTPYDRFTFSIKFQSHYLLELRFWCVFYMIRIFWKRSWEGEECSIASFWLPSWFQLGYKIWEGMRDHRFRSEERGRGSWSYIKTSKISVWNKLHLTCLE